MGERKVLNKYFPPDFDPSKLPKGKRPDNNYMKVRMMMAMNVQCQTCGVFIYKGTKFNMRKEDVAGEDYLGINIYRFYFRCPQCSSEITFKTDPMNSEYVVEHGAHRTSEPWVKQEVEAKLVKKHRKQEEYLDNLKAFENRTNDSKQEMDILADIEETRLIRGQQDNIGVESALETIRDFREKEEKAYNQKEYKRMIEEKARYIRRLSKNDLIEHDLIIHETRSNKNSYKTAKKDVKTSTYINEKTKILKPIIIVKN